MKSYSKLQIKQYTIDYTIEPQTAPSGRPFQLIGLDLYKEKIYNYKKVQAWVYNFKYLDEKGGYISFLFNYENKFLRILK